MLKSIVLSAFGAGLLVGVVLTAVQFFTTEPLILQGEVYEQAGEATAAPVMDTPAVAGAPHEHAAGTAEHHHEEGAWEPADGFERSFYTLLANLLMGVAVSAMLLGVMAVKGDPITASRGLAFGVAGFFAASLLPSLGLSPELPGTAAAEITSRQIWWLGTALASAIGLGLILLSPAWWSKLAGVFLAVLPHVIGAPEPPTLEAAYPAALGAEFVAASLVASALLWSLAGAASGWLYGRLAERRP